MINKDFEIWMLLVPRVSPTDVVLITRVLLGALAYTNAWNIIYNQQPASLHFCNVDSLACRDDLISFCLIHCGNAKRPVC